MRYDFSSRRARTTSNHYNRRVEAALESKRVRTIILWLGTVCALLGLSACGGGSGSPAAPSPQPTPLFSISGTVSSANGGTPLPAARIEVTDGPNRGRVTTSANDGRYQLEGLQPGQISLQVSAQGFDAETRTLSLGVSQTADFVLRRVPRGLSGSIVDGLTENAVAGATVEIDGLSAITAGPDGAFQIDATDPEQTRLARIRSAVSVERSTHLRIPGSNARLTLIPSSFDLSSFDLMFRSGGPLRRWIDVPRVTFLRPVLRFTTVSASEYVATGATMSEADIDLLRDDLVWGLRQLTANRFDTFADERRETATAAESVRVLRTGEIVVARYDGLQSATGFWGYGRWATDGAGTVLGGIIMLDLGFDTSSSPFRRSLRVHELGHALGYNHVTRTSVMHASARFEPNEFDIGAAKLAFLRPPGNRTPDTDPDPFTANFRSGLVIWSAGIH